MACLEMHNQNSDKKGLVAPSMSPRISFSHDFVESSHSHSQMRVANYRDAPVSSDFEFSVTNNSMMSADELFFKGRLLPFKENCKKTTTLRDKLQQEDDEFTLRPPKNPTRWRGFLGLGKSHFGPKKSDKAGFQNDGDQISKNSQNSVE